MRTATGENKILVIDDDADIRDFLEMALSLEGYAVSIAENRNEALEILANDPPSAILMDLYMVGMTAEQFLREITPIRPFTPVVLMTAANECEKQAVKLTLPNFLAKPFDYCELLEMMKRVVEARPVLKPSVMAEAMQGIQNERRKKTSTRMRPQLAM